MNNNNNVTIIREVQFKFTDEEFENKYLNNWLKRFKYKEVKVIYNLLKLRQPELLNYGLSFMMPVTADRNITPIANDISLNLFKQIIEKILLHIGFNEMVKDYIIVLYIGKEKNEPTECDKQNSDYNPDTFNQDYLSYCCDILFDIPVLKEEEIKLSLKNYFNYYFFKYKIELYWFNPFFDEIDHFFKKKCTSEEREVQLKRYKTIIAPFEKELADSSNKLVDSYSLSKYIRYLLDEIFFRLPNPNTFNLILNDENFNKLCQDALEIYRKVTLDEIPPLCITENMSEFNMIKYVKEGDDLKAEYLENFSKNKWYEFPDSGMFKTHIDWYDVQFSMSGYGVYKQFLEDAKREYSEK